VPYAISNILLTLWGMVILLMLGAPNWNLSSRPLSCCRRPSSGASRF